MSGRSRGEYLMCEYLELLLPDNTPFDNMRYAWLVNSQTNQTLEIDRYYPELKVGFEFQGEQHFHQVAGMGDYKQIAYLDRLKKSLCKQRGILLVPVKPVDLRAVEMKKIAKKASAFSGVRKYKYDATKLNHSALHKLDCSSVDYRHHLAELYPENLYIYK